MPKRLLGIVAAILSLIVARGVDADSTVPALPAATSLTSASTYLAQTGSSDNNLGFITSVFGTLAGALTINNGGITNAMLANSSLTVNGTTCTLGSSCSPSGGGGSITVTGGGNTTTGATTVAFGNGFVATPNGANTTSTVNLTVTDNTKSADYTVAAGDMANALNLTGSHTLTLPAASSTIFAPGMSVTVANLSSGSWTVTNSTGLTYNGPATLPKGSQGSFIANADGTHLDWFGTAPDGTTIVLASGQITAAGASATSITPGTTTIIGATSPCLIENSTSTTMACPGVGTGVITALGNNANATGGFGTVGTSGSNVGLLNANKTDSGVNTWSGIQLTTTQTPTISTATFTPLFNTTANAKQNIRVVLVHASCPCTLANPASLGAGQSGMFEIVQSSTGSDTIGTWGSEYEYAGGTSTITLSTAANAVDYLPYYVDSTASFIVLGGIIKGPAH